MTQRAAIAKVHPAATPGRGIMGQRRCACGDMDRPSGARETGPRTHEAGTIERVENRASGVSPIVRDVLRSPGRPLDSALLAFMEPRFGNDFSQVRVHDDSRADESARALNARAYTAGRDVVFGRGEYVPHSESGRRLLAHELAHVVQQRDASSEPISVISDCSSAAEIEADRAAAAVAEGAPAFLSRTQVTPVLQRQARQAADVREQIITLGESDDAADRQRALDLILTTYYERPAHFRGIVYDPNFESRSAESDMPSPHDAETGPSRGGAQFGGEQTIFIGPRFFISLRSRFEQRVRTIGHELQHVTQRSPANERSFGRTLGGVVAGLAAGGVAGLLGLGFAALAGGPLGGGLIGGVLAGSAGLGGLIGGLADPFRRQDEPVRDRNTREFLAIHWVVTASVPGIAALPRRRILQNINQPREGALDRYQRMPPADQRRYHRQYEEILEIKRRLESEQRHRSARDISTESPETGR